MAIFNVGAGGGSTNGVYVGTTEPTDHRTTVWIVPDGTPTTPEDIANALSISANTSTTLTGMLKGDNGNMTQAVAGTDYSTPVVDNVVTASASAWSNNTITLSVTGVMADSKLEIGLSETATDEQYIAATAAQIRATGSGDGTVMLKAVATPSIDLPILIRRLS